MMNCNVYFFKLQKCFLVGLHVISNLATRGEYKLRNGAGQITRPTLMKGKRAITQTNSVVAYV